MFNVNPKILAHISALNVNNFVVPEYILNKGNDGVNLFRRYCPHRMYPLANPGENVENIICKFHGFEWSKNGEPLNNNKNIACGKAQIGKSGLIFKDFSEPNNHWVTDLAQEKALEYSHSFQGTSQGSWLWLMEAEADLLHLYGEEGIHPFLSKQIKVSDIIQEQGDGWILQNHPNGWWLYVFPHSFVEYGRPGMVMVNTVYPKNKDSEYGFDWITQFYYSKSASVESKFIFETLEDVFRQDVNAIEKQKVDYFPLASAINEYENHCVHFGKWYKEHKSK